MAEIDPLEMEVNKKKKESKDSLESKIDSIIEALTELTRIVGGLAKSQGVLTDKIKAGKF
jgi:hypothetical protein